MEKAIKAARLADALRDLLATWVHRDFPEQFIAITQVTLSSDLKRAVAWFDLPSEDSRVLERLQERLPAYQRQLYRTLQKRAIPTVSFAPEIRLPTL